MFIIVGNMFIKKITSSKVWLISFFTAVFVIGFTATYFTLKISKAFVKTSPAPTPLGVDSAGDVNFGQQVESVKEEGVYNTVFLGYGGSGHDGSLLTDSIIVLHVNTNNKSAAIISIPRDLWVNGNHKINAEASINGFQNMGGVIKSVTGLHVGYFAAVDFSGFTKLIDSLDGVTVNVPKTFTDPFYPIKGRENDTCGKSEEEIAALKAKYSSYQLERQFACRYEELHFDQGQTSLDGTTALKFVRSRHGDSDFGRSERQFAVLKGILSKLISTKSFEKTNNTVDKLVSIVKTNLSVPAIRSLIDMAGNADEYKITEIHLTTQNLLNEGKSSDGAYILYPKAGMLDFSGIQSYISNSISN